ncbi:hypothetical protein Pelo_11492 [Pelomyxa schiedti]|nr:hypothetical protein Pelo_11492 [Pelomyxa schiedti]
MRRCGKAKVLRCSRSSNGTSRVVEFDDPQAVSSVLANVKNGTLDICGQKVCCTYKTRCQLLYVELIPQQVTVRLPTGFSDDPAAEKGIDREIEREDRDKELSYRGKEDRGEDILVDLINQDLCNASEPSRGSKNFKLCVYYQKGYCSRGRTCDFLHVLFSDLPKLYNFLVKRGFTNHL